MARPRPDSGTLKQKYGDGRDAEKGRERNRKYYERHKGEAPFRERVNRYAKESRLRAQVSAFMLLGGVCGRCKNNDMRVLEIDHVNGDGAKDRRIGKHELCRRVMAEPFRFQLLCANCHTIKHWEQRQKEG